MEKKKTIQKQLEILEEMHPKPQAVKEIQRDK